MNKSECLLVGIRLVSDAEGASRPAFVAGVAGTNAGGSVQHSSSGYGSVNSLLSADSPAYNCKATTCPPSSSSNGFRRTSFTSSSSSSFARRPDEDTQRIGLVVCQIDGDEMNLKQFRELMEIQIARLPDSFSFLSTRRLPIASRQEHIVPIKSIILEDGCIEIQRHFEIPRCGITSLTGECYGFIFVEPQMSANAIREMIQLQLQELDPSLGNLDFRLLDSNGWPISPQQEYHLVGWDLMHRDCIRISRLKQPQRFDTDEESSTFEHKLNARNASTITLIEDYQQQHNNHNNHHHQQHHHQHNHHHHSLNEDGQTDDLVDNSLHSVAHPSYTGGGHLYRNRHQPSPPPPPPSSSSLPFLTPHLIHHPHQPQYSSSIISHPSPLHPLQYRNSASPFRSHSASCNKLHSIDAQNSRTSCNCHTDYTYNSQLRPIEYTTDETVISAQTSSSTHKTILISYVRKEAEQHARRLKSKLINLGCEVYLDVDEITVGNDWQDSLNNAVANCEIFLPLITPNYGMTLWTNREIKYADMKKKIILPINFLSTWPPECLAIQFATTQFLPWKTMEEIDLDYKSEGERAFDIRHWDDRFVSRTAQQISDLVKKKSLTRPLLSSELDSTLTTSDSTATITTIDSNEDEETDQQPVNNGTAESFNTNQVLDMLSLGQSGMNEKLLANAKFTADHHHQQQSTPSSSSSLPPSDEQPRKASYASKVKNCDKLTYAETLLSNLPLLKVDEPTTNVVEPTTTTTTSTTMTTAESMLEKSADKTEQQTIPSVRKISIRSQDTQPSASDLAHSFGESTYAGSSSSTTTTTTTNQQTDHKMLVVISAHPKQRAIVQDLRQELNKYYNVWSSTDMCPGICSTTSVSSSTDEPDNLNVRNIPLLMRSGSIGGQWTQIESTRRRPSRLDLTSPKKSFLNDLSPLMSPFIVNNNNNNTTTTINTNTNTITTTSSSSSSSSSSSISQAMNEIKNFGQSRLGKTKSKLTLLTPDSSQASFVSFDQTPIKSPMKEEFTIQEHLEKATEFIIPTERRLNSDLSKSLPSFSTASGTTNNNNNTDTSSGNGLLEIPCESLDMMERETRAIIDLNHRTQSTYCQKMSKPNESRDNLSSPSTAQRFSLSVYGDYQRTCSTWNACSNMNGINTGSSVGDDGGRKASGSSSSGNWINCGAAADHGSHMSILPPDEIDKVNIFKEKVNQARIVIILLSEDYCVSRTCKRQAFYCDFRKQVLPVQLESIADVPHWVSKLMCSPDLVRPQLAEGQFRMPLDSVFFESVCTKLCNIVRCDERVNACPLDEHTRYLSCLLERSLALRDRPQIFVYIAGSGKFKKCNTKPLCVKMGKFLAARENIVLVTGGSNGVADAVANSFYQERMRMAKESTSQVGDQDTSKTRTGSKSDDNQEFGMTSTPFKTNRSLTLDERLEPDDQLLKFIQDSRQPLHVLHVLPKHDPTPRRAKYPQNADGSFRAPKYGQTIVIGNSLQERDSLVARVFHFCILIEGGSGSAKLAQEFIYNENLVIPICATGGAAAGKFIPREECGNNITEVPAGVNEEDWINLKSKTSAPCELGRAVINVIYSLAEYRAIKHSTKLQDIQKQCKERYRHRKSKGNCGKVLQFFNSSSNGEDKSVVVVQEDEQQQNKSEHNKSDADDTVRTD